LDAGYAQPTDLKIFVPALRRMAFLQLFLKYMISLNPTFKSTLNLQEFQSCYLSTLWDHYFMIITLQLEAISYPAIINMLDLSMIFFNDVEYSSFHGYYISTMKKMWHKSCAPSIQHFLLFVWTQCVFLSPKEICLI